MVIPVTDEMIQAYNRAWKIADHGTAMPYGNGVRRAAGIAAVLAIVERDFPGERLIEEAREEGYRRAKRETIQELERRCPASIASYKDGDRVRVWCQREIGHIDLHAHNDGEMLVQW